MMVGNETHKTVGKIPNEPWRARALAAMTLGLAATLTLFAVLRQWERLDLQAGLAVMGGDRTAALQERVSGCLNSLYAIRVASFTGTNFDRHGFRALAAEYVRQRPEAHAYGWVARVRREEQAAFEEQARRDGFSGFAIHGAQASNGSIVTTTAAASERWVFLVREPTGGDPKLVGFDIATDQAWAPLLEQARDAGKAVRLPFSATRGAELGPEEVILAVPVYRPGSFNTVTNRRVQLQGFVLGVFDLGKLVDDALRPLEVSEIHFQILEAGVHRLHLHASRARQAGPSGADAAFAHSDDQYEGSLHLAQTTCTVRFVPSKTYLRDHQRWGSWVLLTAGVVLSAVAVLRVRALSTRVPRLRQDVEIRTSEPEASKRSEESPLALNNDVFAFSKIEPGKLAVEDIPFEVVAAVPESSPPAPTTPAVRATTPAAPLPPTAAPPATAPGEPARQRVLLVEDNATNQRLACRLLEKLHCRVDVAANGREALALATRHPYELIFMDCHMPEMDGYEATQEFRRWERAQAEDRQTRPRVPIVALTASVLESDRKRCADAGMDDFISKPVRLDDLRAALQKWPAAAARAA